MTISDLLFSSPCMKTGLCRKPNCEHSVGQFPETNRWFILFAHAGFNSPTNNSNGYATKSDALRAIGIYLKKSNSYKTPKYIES